MKRWWYNMQRSRSSSRCIDISNVTVSGNTPSYTRNIEHAACLCPRSMGRTPGSCAYFEEPNGAWKSHIFACSCLLESIWTMSNSLRTTISYGKRKLIRKISYISLEERQQRIVTCISRPRIHDVLRRNELNQLMNLRRFCSMNVDCCARGSFKKFCCMFCWSVTVHANKRKIARRESTQVVCCSSFHLMKCARTLSPMSLSMLLLGSTNHDNNWTVEMMLR